MSDLEHHFELGEDKDVHLDSVLVVNPVPDQTDAVVAPLVLATVPHSVGRHLRSVEGVGVGPLEVGVLHAGFGARHSSDFQYKFRSLSTNYTW